MNLVEILKDTETRRNHNQLLQYNGTITRFRDNSLNGDEGRNYDFDKITPELVGKQISVECFTIAFNPETNLRAGAYLKFTGTVQEIKFDNIKYVLFSTGELFDPYSGTDFKLEVLN